VRGYAIGSEPAAVTLDGSSTIAEHVLDADGRQYSNDNEHDYDAMSYMPHLGILRFNSLMALNTGMNTMPNWAACMMETVH